MQLVLCSVLLCLLQWGYLLGRDWVGGQRRVYRPDWEGNHWFVMYWTVLTCLATCQAGIIPIILTRKVRHLINFSSSGTWRIEGRGGIVVCRTQSGCKCFLCLMVPICRRDTFVVWFLLQYSYLPVQELAEHCWMSAVALDGPLSVMLKPSIMAVFKFTLLGALVFLRCRNLVFLLYWTRRAVSRRVLTSPSFRRSMAHMR